MRCHSVQIFFSAVILTVPIQSFALALTSPLLSSYAVARPPLGEQEPIPAERPAAETLIRNVFAAYKAALIAGDGHAAAQLVDASTMGYFGSLKELAVHADQFTLKARPFVDRLLVISMRQIMEPAELKSLELGELMNRAVSEGWISPQTVAQLDIGEVTVNDEFAVAEAKSLNPALSLESPDSDEGLEYKFSMENGEWKFGFASLVESLNGMVEEFTAQLGTDQDDLIFVLVQSLTGKPVLPEVWNVSGQEVPQ